MACLYKNVDIKRPQEQSVTTSLIAKLHSAVNQNDLSKGNSQLSKSKQDVINQEGNNKIHHTPDNISLSSSKHDPTLNSTVLALQRLKKANKFGTISSASSCTKPANFGSKSNRNYSQPNSKYIQKGTQKHTNHDSLSSNVDFQEDNANRFEEQEVDNSLHKLVNIFDNSLHYTWKLETHKRSVRKDHIISHIASKMSEIQSTGTSSSIPSTAPPPPPPPGPPPPPPPAQPMTINKKSNQDGRSALLSSIQKGTKLKPTKTRDCSSPLVGGSSKTVSATGSSGSNSSALKSFTVDRNDDHLNVLKQALKQRPMKSGDTTSQRKEDRKFSLAEGVKTPNTAKETRSKSTWIAPNITRNGVAVASGRVENEGNKCVNSTSQNSSEISHNVNDQTKEGSFKNRKGSSMTPTAPCQKQSDEITHLNDQQGNSIEATADKNSFCEVRVQDKATVSAVAQQSKELMPADSDITERKKKVSVDILRTIEDGPNLKPKETTNRNFGERMAAMQKEGKLVTRKEHEETMQKGANKKEFTEDKEQPQPNISWKSEYSVSNEGSKSASDMFGLSASQQHRAKPSPLPNVTVLGSPTDVSKSKNVSPTQHGAVKNYGSLASISKSNGTSSPMSATKVKNGSKPPSSQMPNQGKINPDDVKICSCVETTSFDGTNKCSHSSDPSAIHLDMDKVMKFLGDVKK